MNLYVIDRKVFVGASYTYWNVWSDASRACAAMPLAHQSPLWIYRSARRHTVVVDKQTDASHLSGRPCRILGGLKHSAFPLWSAPMGSSLYIICRYPWTWWIDSRLRRVIPTQNEGPLLPQVFSAQYSELCFIFEVAIQQHGLSSSIWLARQVVPSIHDMRASCWAEIRLAEAE